MSRAPHDNPRYDNARNKSIRQRTCKLIGEIALRYVDEDEAWSIASDASEALAAEDRFWDMSYEPPTAGLCDPRKLLGLGSKEPVRPTDSGEAS